MWYTLNRSVTPFLPFQFASCPFSLFCFHAKLLSSKTIDGPPSPGTSHIEDTSPLTYLPFYPMAASHLEPDPPLMHTLTHLIRNFLSPAFPACIALGVAWPLEATATPPLSGYMPKWRYQIVSALFGLALHGLLPRNGHGSKFVKVKKQTSIVYTQKHWTHEKIETNFLGKEDLFQEIF